jgi:hypothetical protein
MKRISVLMLAAVVGATLTGCALQSMAAKAPEETAIQQQAENHDEEQVAALVEEFGTKLKLVSLLAPQDVVGQSMEEHYGSYVSDELLAKWQHDPEHAPGRMVSSPWPERIEISAVEKIADDAYQVTGEIIEVTSTDLEGDDVANKIPITLTVKKFESGWLIDDVSFGSDEEHDSSAYTNHEYGFKFALPESWKGYTIVTDKWEGSAPGSAEVDETGPMIIIRHPDWKAEEPRQDIPILILTLAQWDALQQEKFHIGAAPIGPSELGRNDKYVFALPARYNFEFLKGYEEVEQILESNPLEPIQAK